MSVEVIGAWVGKIAISLIWTPFATYIWWTIKRDKKKLDDTYTKQETENLLNIKLDAQERATQLQLQANDDKTQLQLQANDEKLNILMALIKTDIEDAKADRNKTEDTLKQIQKSISTLSTKTAVTINKVENLENRG
jgi:hypothetical protein